MSMCKFTIENMHWGLLVDFQKILDKVINFVKKDSENINPLKIIEFVENYINSIKNISSYNNDLCQVLNKELVEPFQQLLDKEEEEEIERANQIEDIHQIIITGGFRNRLAIAA